VSSYQPVTNQQPVTSQPELAVFVERFDRLAGNVSRVVQGKAPVVRAALHCILAEGHLLLEDVPGVGKTSLARAIAASIDVVWNRIQFTPDLLPSDVTGTSVFDQSNATFSFRPGPVFANVVIADEINRASPKTQAALLEAMEERQVTVDATTYRLPAPFLVIATQNPVEHEGTYPLPESQLDRFLLRVRMGYPDRSAEIAMLDHQAHGVAVDDLEPVVGPDAVPMMVALANRVHVAAALKGYVVDLATATRRHPSLSLGMSPRAALALQRAARALAASAGRDYATPDDIKSLIAPVLAHRLVLSPDASIAGTRMADILGEVLRSVPVPSGR
jgi:MoxR-like ATPase